MGWGGRWRWNRGGMIEGGVWTSLAAVESAKIEENNPKLSFVPRLLSSVPHWHREASS